MSQIDLEKEPVKTLFPGYEARLVHMEGMTLSYVDVEAGAAFPEHGHVHEQVVNVLSGEFELVVEGKAHRLKPGVIFTIPSNVRHSGTAITECRILDVFCPTRDDLR